MKKRILFVDDEPNVLQGLQRMLRPMRLEWDMAFIESGQEALELLAQNPFDVIVSDMRMPGMDGAQLLTEVRRRYPHMVRLILSGHSEHEMIMRSVGPTHQFLAKPCEAETLKAAVLRACALRELLANESLRQVVAGMQTLPSLPTLYLEVVEAAQSADSSLEKIGKIVERDIGMAAKILQLVNSAFFGLPRHISSPVQAVSLLGLDTVKALILSVQIFTDLSPARVSGFSLDTLWEHSIAVGTGAKRIARLENDRRELMDDALLAGLLHDVGKLVLAMNLGSEYGQALALAQTDGMPNWEAERATLGTTHAEVGAYLLGLWGLPDAMIEALAFHHQPLHCPDRTFSPLTAVHVANALVHEGGGADRPEATNGLDLDYLGGLGLGDRVSVWRQDYQAALSAISGA